MGLVSCWVSGLNLLSFRANKSNNADPIPPTAMRDKIITVTFYVRHVCNGRR
jgi:hypothetical protein